MLSYFRSKIRSYEEKIPEEILTRFQDAQDLAENILSCFKHLESQRDFAIEFEKKAIIDANKLRDKTSEVAQEKEAKH